MALPIADDAPRIDALLVVVFLVPVGYLAVTVAVLRAFAGASETSATTTTAGTDVAIAATVLIDVVRVATATAAIVVVIVVVMRMILVAKMQTRIELGRGVVLVFECFTVLGACKGKGNGEETVVSEGIHQSLGRLGTEELS